MLPSFADSLPEFLRPIIKKIDGAGEWDKFTSDWIKYLWYDESGLAGISIKKILTEPLSGLINMFSAFGGGSETKANASGKFDNPSDSYLQSYLMSKSIKDIVNDFNESLSGADVKPFDFTSFANVCKALYKSEKYNLATAWKSSKPLHGLGLNDNGTTIQDSPMYFLEKMLKDNRAMLLGVFNLIQDYINEMTRNLDNLKKTYQTVGNMLDINYTVESDTKFIYELKYNDKSIKFQIELADYKNKSYISAISVVE
ncbi:hypothetical protein SHELI_v1c10540 [Spiroplasma helicoides]|uniref:Uncharacterized protein n=1 Tax=Spiroplasma helicoides TaxID=216938 RepID=A0A1B3SM32_9MOLU|nr:hypothetical protein [Spiroplasma helicoides]AOG61001.1 hypothetical protein SHELI_v1c10540 [Spiroplasma helicoides]